MPAKKLTAAEWRKNVPFGLRAIPHWVGHKAKRPISPATGKAAKVDDPTTWGSFDEAVRFYEKHEGEADAGAGFVFTDGDNLTFIDLDHVLTDGKWTGPEELRTLMAGASGETYVEISPSGTGLHIIGLGTLPAAARHSKKVGKSSIEAYSHGRYSTITAVGIGCGQVGPIHKRIKTVADYLGVAEASREDDGGEAPAPERAPEVAEALSHLDPDMPYDQWLRVGMALKSGLGDAGRALWLTWSREGKKSKPGEPEAKWTSFQRTGVGLGTLLQWAKDAGWEHEAPRPRPEDEFEVLTGEAESSDEDAGLRLIPLDQVAPEKVQWLWKGRLALGHLTLIAGDGGQGKSIMSLDIAARLTRGMPLPGDAEPRKPCRVLLLNAEDGQADTLRPRAAAAGADLSRIVVLDLLHGGRPPQLPDDVKKLENYIKQAGDVKLVVLDPLNTCLPVRLDSHKDQHVRQALMPLAAMAMRLKVAVALVVHLNKANDTASTLYRVSGSIGIGAAARSVLFVGPHPENEGERVVAQAKPQLGPPPPSLSFRVVGSAADSDVGLVEWGGEVEVEAGDMVAKPRMAQTGKIDEACMWLEARLGAGPVPSAVLVPEARACGFGEKTLRLAHDRIGGERVKDGYGGTWTWHGPKPFEPVK